MLEKLTTQAGSSMRPDYMLKFGSKDITNNIKNRLISLTLTENRASTADEFTMVLDDADGLFELPARGSAIGVFIGWKGSALTDKGSFVVDEINHTGAPDKIHIHARSADFRGPFNSSREESWHDTTLGDIVEAIAKRNNLTASILPALASIHIPHIDQSQESDAAFLTRLAQRNGAAAAVKYGKLMVFKPGLGVTASGEEITQITLSRCDGDNHSFFIADRQAYTGVTARWLDTETPQNQQKKINVKRKTKTQSSVQQQHPNAKTEAKKNETNEQEANSNSYMIGDAYNVFALKTIYATREQAMRAAQAKWDLLQRKAAKFSLKLARGRADLYPEVPVKLTGFKGVIDKQLWTINKVNHVMDNNGYTMTITFERKLANDEYEAEEITKNANQNLQK